MDCSWHVEVLCCTVVARALENTAEAARGKHFDDPEVAVTPWHLRAVLQRQTGIRMRRV